jgi:hypothetical protein
MGGTSTSNTTQSSSTSPWATGQTAVDGILGQLNPLVANSGLSSAETNALSGINGVAAAGNPNAAAIQSSAAHLLNGGGAQNQDGALNSAYQNYYNQTNPLASNTNYDPTQNPQLQALLQTIRGDVGNSVNGQFAAAGRDFSGMNQQTLARGISQGEAAPLLAQYNTNVANQQGAAQNLYNAGNATAGALNGTQTAANANQIAGTTQATAANTANLQPYQTALTAAQLAQSIPAANLGLLAQIGIPIAGLGTNSTGQSSTTNQASLTSQIASLGGLLGSGGSTGANGATSGGSGIMGLLGML